MDREGEAGEKQRDGTRHDDGRDADVAIPCFREEARPVVGVGRDQHLGQPVGGEPPHRGERQRP
jgi:hypothetical protein